jgi:SAM-dependent MidA family methyltransferase
VSSAATESTAALRDLICGEIVAAGRPISFARFMDLVLYAPGLGYYSGGCEKFGPDGDFVTAPELSTLFGRCIARQAQPIIAGLSGGDILEFGAGTGRLAADVLQELERLSALPDRYYILEVSADLRARQRALLAERLPRLLRKIVWLDAPPSAFRGVILANEVLDAMPVHRFQWTDDGPYEWCVGISGDAFDWARCPVDNPDLLKVLDNLRAELPAPLALPYTSEVNLHARAWIGSIADALAQGVLLCIDYGYPRHEYYHPERRNGTLICHHRHRAHAELLTLPGQQDITAFVDFTAVAEAAVEYGLAVAGYTTQAHFLLSSGLDEILRDLQAREPAHYPRYAQQAKWLALPGEMGERFKVMALAKDFDKPLLGFARFDQRHRL